jgi:ABC-2 type transport system permease protein
LNRYLAIVKNSVLEVVVYRAHFIFTSIGNILFIFLIHYLWRAIFGGRSIINGMSFNQVFVYLALATTIFNMFVTFVDWDMSYSMLDGSIIIPMIRPLDYQLQMFARKLGGLLLSLAIIAIPALGVVFGVFRAEIEPGVNLLLFPISLLFSYLISFALDFFIGSLSFYTQSVWGISNTKNVIVMLLSGAVVPLGFFPENLHKAMGFLPFQAIYDTPLRILTQPDLTGDDYGLLFLRQISWVILVWFLSRKFYQKAIKKVTVNGG